MHESRDSSQRRRASIPIIGLVGGVGAGKSAVASVLASLGCVVMDSDAEARALLDDAAVQQTLVSWWGERVLTRIDGVLRADRAAIGAIVFADPAERKRLEALIHPMIHARRRERIAMLERGAADVAKPRGIIIDAPLLFEAAVDRECDAVIFVDAPESLRLARVRQRQWDEAEWRRREAAQLPLDEKRSRSSDVVVNDADLAILRTRVEQALLAIERRIRGSSTP